MLLYRSGDFDSESSILSVILDRNVHLHCLSLVYRHIIFCLFIFNYVSCSLPLSTMLFSDKGPAHIPSLKVPIVNVLAPLFIISNSCCLVSSFQRLIDCAAVWMIVFCAHAFELYLTLPQHLIWAVKCLLCKFMSDR